MSPNKKKKTQAEPANESSLAPKGAYEGGGGLYDGGPEHRSLKDEMDAYHRHVRNERDSKLHGTSKSKHARQDVEERQVIPLLFLFKWAVLGGVGLGLVLVLKMFLGGFNKNAADEISELRAQVAELERIQIDRPLLDLADTDQIPVLVKRWKQALDNTVAAEGFMRWDRREEALRRLRDALLVAPECQAARVLTAQIAMKNEDYERAANLLVHALNADPERYDLALQLAQALEKMTEDQAAFAVAEWTLSRQAGNLEALGIASRTSVRLEDWASALKYFDKILIVDENNLEALKGASAIYLRDENYAKALPLFMRLMDRESDVWQHFFNAAVCQAQLEQPNKTVTTLEVAAANFGDARIFGWVGASQFDPVREDDLFSGFQQRVTRIAQGKAQKKIEVEEEPVLAPVAPTIPAGDALQLKK